MFRWKDFLPIVLPLSILIIWMLLAIIGSYFSLNANQIILENLFKSPSLDNFLGYDDLGRPLFDRLVTGASVSFFVSIGVICVSLTVGTTIGMLSAWIGGRFDRLIVHIIDIFLAFPSLLLAIALAGLLGAGINNVIIALSLTGWVGYARLARAQTLSLKQREHVLAAQALGASSFRILHLHILPLLVAPLIVEATFGIASVVLAEAGLSFLGIGIQPPMASWGNMIRDGMQYLLIAPHLVLVPSFALLCVILATNLLGDRLRDWLDVKRQQR